MKLVCLGDSFTKGFGVKSTENWVSQIEIENIEIINRGINGDTTSGMLARFNNDVVSEAPNYVLITGGTNDFISGSDCGIPQNNYMAMVHQAFHNGIIPVAGIEPGFSPQNIRKDWAAFGDFREVLNKQLQLREWIKKMCRTFGVFYIDFYEELKKETQGLPEKNLFVDGLHLTAYGHELIAEIAERAFRDIVLRMK